MYTVPPPSRAAHIGFFERFGSPPGVVGGLSCDCLSLLSCYAFKLTDRMTVNLDVALLNLKA